MKKFILFAGLLTALATQAQYSVEVSGDIKGLPDTTMISFRSLSNLRLDSVMPSNGHFSLKLNLPERDMYIIRFGKDIRIENTSALLYLQEGKFIIKGKGPMAKDLAFSGSPFAVDFNDFTQKLATDKTLITAPALYKKYNDAYAQKDSIAMKGMDPQLKMMDSLRKSISRKWFDMHISSPVSSFVLYWYIREQDNLAEVETLLNKVPADVRKNAMAKKMQVSIDAAKALVIGKLAPLFTQNDTLNTPVSLASFKGKYVLVDFWASWCVPCRAENPKVVEAYAKYNKKNYTVLSVSLDQPGAKDKWIKAIHDDGLTWTHVSDLKYWDNAVAKQYDIHSIPANFLISPEGIIVGKDLRGDDLEKKLAELIGTNK